MSNLRIFVKRNGEKVVQKRTCRYDQEPCNCPDEITTWKDLPIVHEPEEEKSFGQVAYDMWQASGTGATYPDYTSGWERVAQAVLSEARKRGWKEPDNAS